MKRIRCVEETIAARYAQWQMRCPVHLSVGQDNLRAAPLLNARMRHANSQIRAAAADALGILYAPAYSPPADDAPWGRSPEIE